MARFLVGLCLVFLTAAFVVAQTPPTNDPQALALAAKSIAALTGGTAVTDVTLTGVVTWSGGETDTGVAALRALAGC